MTKPISPDDVAEAKIIAIPDYVFKVFNEEIALHFTNGSATVKQKDVVDRILEEIRKNSLTVPKMPMIWLNVAEAYEDYQYRVLNNYDAIRVKMADLRHNSDFTRLNGAPKYRDLERLAKYAKFYDMLRIAAANYENS